MDRTNRHLGPVYTMHIYSGKLQKRINISPYQFYPLRQNSIRLRSIPIKTNTEKKVDKYLSR